MLAFYRKSIPLTIGLILSIIGLKKYVDIDDSVGTYVFLVYAIIGFPTLFYGIHRISENEK